MASIGVRQDAPELLPSSNKHTVKGERRNRADMGTGTSMPQLHDIAVCSTISSALMRKNRPLLPSRQKAFLNQQTYNCVLNLWVAIYSLGVGDVPLFQEV
jgi:hypothetical protein